MFGVCIQNTDHSTPLVIPAEYGRTLSEDNFVASKEWYTVDDTTSGYCLTVGASYEIYGILSYNNKLRYLVLDDSNIPGFFPSTIFTIQNNDVFFDWKIQEYNIQPTTVLVAGYPAIAESYSSLVELVKGTNNAIYDFLKYKDRVLALSQA